MQITTETLTLLLAAITGTSGLAGAIAWLVTLRPRIEALERECTAIRNALAVLSSEVKEEQGSQWSAIRRLDRQCSEMQTAWRYLRESAKASPSPVRGDVTPIVVVPLRGADESQ